MKVAPSVDARFLPNVVDAANESNTAAGDINVFTRNTTNWVHQRECLRRIVQGNRLLAIGGTHASGYARGCIILSEKRDLFGSSQPVLLEGQSPFASC